MEKVKKLLNNQWIVNICTSLIVVVITPFVISITKKVSLKDSIFIILNFIKGILKFKIPIWVIALFIIIIFATIYIVRLIKPTDSNEHPKWYYDFKAMNYKEWIFTWNYEKSYDGYEIQNLRPICSCGCELTDLNGLSYTHYSGSILKCPNCEKTYAYPPMQVIGSIEQLIGYKIKTNNYSKELSKI